VERDVDRIASLVSDIVEITFVEGDPALRGTETVRVYGILDEVAHDCALEAELRGCSIDLAGHSDGQVLGNPELLRRAVENVVRNAIRYSPEKSMVRISIEENDRDAIITVRDHGPGVPEEMLARIFDPFFRVEEARDVNGGGSGLGLSIAKRAVQLHHGCIVAKNENPGLLVKITLPLVMDDVRRYETASLHSAQRAG
jgi:two-component system sensor histidine kinase CpxA